MANMVTLRCEAGHDWERESQRGRKPRFCPEHRPDVYVPREANNYDSATSHAPATRPEIIPVEIPNVEAKSEPTSRVVTGLVITRGPARTTNSELVEQAIDALSDMHNPEDIRKIAYMIGQIRNGRDLSMQLKEVLRTYKRKTRLESMSEFYARQEEISEVA